MIESIINLMHLVNEFKQMLKSKNVDKIEEWIERANNLKLRKIDKFVNGLKRDIQMVRNAIIYEYNNGLAEGSVNKLKVIKRIMYGRNRFERFRQQVLFLENNGYDSTISGKNHFSFSKCNQIKTNMILMTEN